MGGLLTAYCQQVFVAGKKNPGRKSRDSFISTEPDYGRIDG